MKKKKRLNAIDRSYFNNLFVSVAEEMGGTLARTAYSSNIKERKDFSCAIFDRQARMIAQAAHIPVHLGAMPMSVQAAVRHFPEMNPGDVIMLNDPFAGGTHLPDVTLISPVFDPDSNQLQAFLATRAHHADVGGMSPGSLPLSSSIYQEGLRIPPVKLYDSRQVNEAVVDLFCANSRTPRERRGDLKAQIAAHHVGEQRLLDFYTKHGADFLDSVCGEILDYSDQMMRGLLAEIPNGSYRFADVLDDDGHGTESIPIQVKLTVKDRSVWVDFKGSSPSVRGSLNAVKAITHSAVYYCFICLLCTPSRLHRTAVHQPPLNEGCFRAIDVQTPEDSVVDALSPRAVAGGNVETSQRIVDVVFGALAKALPDLIPAASQGTMNNLTIGGQRAKNGEAFAYYETIGGGSGASAMAAGASGLQVHMTNTLNTPIEALEYAYPFRMRHYGLRSASGGAGQFKGGEGVRRELELLEDAEVTLLTDRRSNRPYGLQGGEPGQTGVNSLIRSGKRKVLPAKVNLQAQPGDVIRIDTPGGGGWGKSGTGR